MHDVRIDLCINECAQQVVRRADVVVDRVALQARGLHRVRRGPLLGEVDDGVGLPRLQQIHEPAVLARHVERLPVEGPTSDFLPGPTALGRRSDRGQRFDLLLHVDMASAEVVEDDHLMALRGKMQ